jgi:hypothetical protein
MLSTPYLIWCNLVTGRYWRIVVQPQVRIVLTWTMACFLVSFHEKHGILKWRGCSVVNLKLIFYSQHTLCFSAYPMISMSFDAKGKRASRSLTIVGLKFGSSSSG